MELKTDVLPVETQRKRSSEMGVKLPGHQNEIKGQTRGWEVLNVRVNAQFGMCVPRIRPRTLLVWQLGFHTTVKDALAIPECKTSSNCLI